MDIDFKKQVDLDAGILDLNTPGRVQTIKRRPVIRLTRNLRAWLAEWKAARPLTWHGAAVDDLKKAMQATNARWMMAEAGFAPERIDELMAKGAEKERTKAVQELDAAGAHRITRRVVRSFMGTRIRGLKEIRVDREQREIWLGHQDQDTTSRYEISDPDYLREAADATDLIIGKLQAHCQRSLWPERHQPELPFGKPASPRGDRPDSHATPTIAENRESPRGAEDD